REVARQALAETRGRLDMQLSFAASRQISIGQKVDLDVVDRLVFLRRMFAFPHVSVDAVASIARQMKTKTFRAGDRIWRRGDAAVDLTIVIAGTVECVSDTQRKTLEGGGPLGGIECFGQAARWYDLVAKTDTRVLQTSYDTVLDMFEEHVDMGCDLLSSLAATVLGLRQQRGEMDIKKVEPAAIADEPAITEPTDPVAPLAENVSAVAPTN
ncbi:MAG: Crp/Fnr family transcriptional regulator, partial [Polyangiaceae bacterium]